MRSVFCSFPEAASSLVGLCLRTYSKWLLAVCVHSNHSEIKFKVPSICWSGTSNLCVGVRTYVCVCDYVAIRLQCDFVSDGGGYPDRKSVV